MLARLSIRNVVLIERLDLDWNDGLCALTGETGAGKSILLDSLNLALGARGDKGLVRAGADRASAAAEFALTREHPVWTVIEEAGLEADPADALILRRQLTADGRSRAWVNDASVSVSVLSALGDLLVEIHGQHDDRGLLNAKAHRRLLDDFGGHEPLRKACASAWRDREAAFAALEARRAAAETASQDEAWLRHAVDELGKLKPQIGEEAALDAERRVMMASEKLAAELDGARGALSGEGGGFEASLAAALRGLERVLESAPPGDAPALVSAREAAASLDRALAEAAEAARALDEAASALEYDAGRAEHVEERLFALRDAARKHRTEPDDLPQIRADLESRLAGIENFDAELRMLESNAEAAEAAYGAAADALSDARRMAAKRLDASVAEELPPLKLEKARFETAVDGGAAGPSGRDTVEFRVATNPGAVAGPMIKIASGGELARFILALKVRLAQSGAARTLVFDEVDRGVGGAVADAVGERLARLAAEAQVLVVTHSPQVAARADRQWRIAKSGDDAVVTQVDPLDEDERREEVARMLSGANVTEEARAAAGRLLEEARRARA